MTKNYDQEFGPGGIYAWPGCLDVAERFIESVPYAKSGPDYLDDDFFYEYLDFLDAELFDEHPEEEALKLAKAAAKARQELFRDARNWPLPYLVASATYKILSARDEGVYMITRLGDCFFWLFLCFDEPLFDMLRAKDWGKIYRNEMRKGFKSHLRLQIDGLTVKELMWGSDEGKPWFTCKRFTSHIYSENVLRCLDLIGIDPGLAHLAVDQVFQLQSLVPFYDVLSDDSSSMPATFVGGRHRDEQEETENPNKLSWVKAPPTADLRTHVLNSIYVVLLFAGVAIASTRLRSSRSLGGGPSNKWTSTPSHACFAAASRIGNVRLNERPDHGNLGHIGASTPRTPAEGLNQRLPQEPSFATGVTASASQRPRSRPMLTAWKKVTANLSKLKVLRTKTPEHIRKKNTEKQWRNALQSHRLENQSSVESSGEPAEQSQLLRKEKSAAHLFRQALSDAKTEAQKLTHRLYNRIIERIYIRDTWVENGRIFTDGSPEVKAFRSELAAKGKRLPDDTVLCIHAHRIGGITKFTTQGTVTDCNGQERVMTYIEEHFLIDGQPVVKGAAHENDHVWGSTTANIGGLRHSKRTYDCARTVKLPRKLHALRTSHYARVKPKYSLENLTKPLSEVLKPMAEADRELWSDKNHRDAIFQDGLTPNFLVEQYAEAHRYEVGRMADDLMDEGFDTRQATAYVADGMVREAIESSAREFIDCSVPFPKLKDQNVLTSFARRRAQKCYLEKVRELNLSKLSDYYSECIGFADDFESYSDSPEGVGEGCTPSQIVRHRETKIQAINGFKKALQAGFKRGLKKGYISQTYLNNAVDNMLSVANVDKNGNTRTSQLPTEALKDRIRTRGEVLRMNSLYKRDNVFTVKKPSVEEGTLLYEKCVQNVATELKGTSTPSQQESSDQESLD